MILKKFQANLIFSGFFPVKTVKHGKPFKNFEIFQAEASQNHFLTSSFDPLKNFLVCQGLLVKNAFVF